MKVVVEDGKAAVQLSPGDRLFVYGAGLAKLVVKRSPYLKMDNVTVTVAEPANPPD